MSLPVWVPGPIFLPGGSPSPWKETPVLNKDPPYGKERVVRIRLKADIFFVEDYYVADSMVLQEARMRDKSVCAVCNEKFKDEATAKTHLKSEHSAEEIQKP